MGFSPHHRLDHDEHHQLDDRSLSILSYAAIVLIVLSLAAAALNMSGQVAGLTPHPSLSLAPERAGK